jgi:S1-C subfamily serine protease
MPSEMSENKNEHSVSHRERWRARVARLRTAIRKAVPFAFGVLAAFTALLLYRVVFPGPHLITTSEVSDTVNQALASATPPPAFSVGVYKVIAPSLVLIQSRQAPNADGTTLGELGSGVIIDDSCDILTALHVVAGATAITVTFADGSQSEAQVASTLPANDIAVLTPAQAPAQVVPAVLGNPNDLQVGDEAYVVGNPLGLYGSMSAGVISGFNRSFQPENSTLELKGLIQIDAAVNPGNSGGPLLNRYGQVVGIVEGIANPTSQNFFIGIGFVVPINVAVSGFGSPPY